MELMPLGPGTVHPGPIAGLMGPGTIGLGLDDLETVLLGPVVTPKELETVELGLTPGIFEPGPAAGLIHPEAVELGPGYPGPVQPRPLAGSRRPEPV